MQQDTNLRCLDKLIVDIGGADFGMQSKGECGLLLEHLQAARRNLLGSMRGEYRLSLQQAKESLGCISDMNARAGVKKGLQGLVNADVQTLPSSRST